MKHNSHSVHSTPIAIAAIVLTAIAIELFTMPGCDLVWLSWGAYQMLHGAVLYKDILEPNPPLIFWFYTPPVILAGVLSASPVLTIKFTMMALALGSIAVCNAIAKRSALWQGKERDSLIIAITALLLLTPDAFVTFGNREHIFIILFLPYVFLNFPSAARLDKRIQMAVGIAAGIGICLKPHFFLIWLAATAYRFFKRGFGSLFAVADIAIGIVSAAYLLAVCLFVPQYFEWAAIVLPTYAQYGNLYETAGIKALWFGGKFVFAVAVAWGFGLFKVPKDKPYRADIVYLLCLAAAAYTEGLLQFKTWEYIHYPLTVLGIMAVAIQVLFKPNDGFFAFALMAWIFWPVSPLDDTRQDMNDPAGAARQHVRLMEELKPYGTAKRLQFMSIFWAPPQTYAYGGNLEWASRFNYFNYLLMGTMERSPYTGQPTLTVQPGKERLEAWILDNIAQDFEKTRPEILVIAYFWGDGVPKNSSFDFLEWFKRSPKLMEIMRGYEWRKDLAMCEDPDHPRGHCTYHIYTRKGAF